MAKTLESVVTAASMMNNMFCRKLFFAAAAPLHSSLRCELLLNISPFHLRNVFSTQPLSKGLFYHFASSKLNLSDADIALMFRKAPQLQKLRSLNNVEGFLSLLQKHGCTEVEIAKIVKVEPQLTRRTERTLEPKIKLLEDSGFVDKKLAKLLSTWPSILSHSLENNLLPKMEFLKNVFQSEDALVKALLRYPRLLCYGLEKTLKPSLAFWEGWGFSGAELVSFLQVDPVVLSRTSLTPSRVDLIHKIAPDQRGKMFKYIVSAVTLSRMETLEAKIENFKHCGLSSEQTWQLLGAVPRVMFSSKEHVSEKMNLLVDKTKLPVDYVLKHPNLLHISLEKTMRPRCLVWQKIRSIDDRNLPLLTVLRMTEARFISKIIKGHPDSKTLLKIYEDAISNAPTLNRTKRSTHMF